MKSTKPVGSWVVTAMTLSAAVFLTPYAGAAAAAKPDCETLLSDAIRIGSSPAFEYQGVTESGLQRIHKAAEAFQANEQAFNEFIVGQASIFQVHMLARISRENHLVLGPPGAAKSMSVNWTFPNIWTKQITEWTTPFEIFGGQTRKGLEEGIEDLNTKGSALEAEVALTDEINNGNPGLIGATMSWLNPTERSYTINGKTIEAKTRSVFATGNATRAEILNSFEEHQMQSGPAVLSRFFFHSFVYNWVDLEEQARLDERYARTNQLKILREAGDPNLKALAARELEKYTPRPIDFDLIYSLAGTAFEEDPLLTAALRQMINDLRQRMNTEARKSAKDIEGNKDGFKFEPKADWNERMRSSAMRILKISAAMDLLRLPSDVREKMLQKPIRLSPLSLWRIVELSITNFVGIKFFDVPQARMQFNLIDKTKPGSRAKRLNLERHDLTALAHDSRTALAAAEVEHLQKEQEIFNEVLNSSLVRLANDQKDIAALMNPLDEFDFDKDFDFENAVFNYLWRGHSEALARAEGKKSTTHQGDSPADPPK